MKKRLAIYPGSFNPFHKGHLDILLKAEAIFDEVVIAIGTNPEKNGSKINKLETLKFQLPGKNIEEFDGFLVDFVYEKEDKGYDVTIVRGLRNGADLDYEANQLRVMKDQKPDLKMIFLPCDVRYEHISSSMIRNLEKIKEGSGSEYLVKPEMFENKIEFKISENLNDASVAKHLMDWAKMCEKTEEKKDEWVEFDFIPGRKFKNVKFVPADLEDESIGAISFTVQYDKVEEV